jgi:hypothetical protein
VIPTRAIDLVRCMRGRRAGDIPVRALSAPIIRDGRLRLRERWLEHEFAEADYRHGNGPLRLRLVHVEWSRQVAQEGDTWVEAEGVVVDSCGREGDRRQVLIRAERLPAPPPARKRTRLAGLSNTP